MTVTPTLAQDSAEPDWKRIRSALLQQFRRERADHDHRHDLVDEVLEILPALIRLCGPASRARRTILDIGGVLLRSSLAPTIIAPTCPDYSHRAGRYTCNDISGGVPLLARRHIAFLGDLAQLLPEAKISLLLADQEADDPKIATACGKTHAEFRRLIASSIRQTQHAVSGMGWQVEAMTHVVPDFHEQLSTVAEQLYDQPGLRRRFEVETHQRRRLYSLIDPDGTEEELLLRTINTAAQYVTLGRYARERDQLVCNHTTTNLGWYKRSGTAVLHNAYTPY